MAFEGWGRFLADKLARIFTKSLREGVIPKGWRLANVVALHKKGDKTNVGNYRPISLTSHIAKILEAIIANFVLEKLETDRFFKNQWGFRRNLSRLRV